jgi:molybdenum cofactor synthesis domain-containing protein
MMIDEKGGRVTAAVILIGNELLSGSVADENMHYIANALVKAGITLTEVRVIADLSDVIVKTVRTLKEQVDYVFTTGGIGPTHDDITAEAIAEAFNQPLLQDPETAKQLKAYFEKKGVDANEAQMRMANMPKGGKPIAHAHSVVPGFFIENVYVLAGVPKIMRSMLDAAIPDLKKGKPVLSVSVRCDVMEGKLAKGLGDIQNMNPELDIGSYPLSKEQDFNVSLVVRGTEQLAIDVAVERIQALIVSLDGKVVAIS